MNVTKCFFDDQLIPIKVNGFNDEKVVMISCGYCHSMALTESGRVFVWGSNSKGQLGLRNIDKYDKYAKSLLRTSSVLFLNQNLEYDNSMRKISCGKYHSLLLSSNGEIYWFGWNGIGDKKQSKNYY
jgi:alpha-tubulin suppressor-like RCC1 family protein